MANIAKINLPDGNTYDIVDKKSGYYTKPSSGIPKSDLASDVQTSLGKADSALLVTGDTSYTYFTGGGSAQNIAGYRLIATEKMHAWLNRRVIFAVSGRHGGNGIFTVAYGCNANDINISNTYCQINYFGNTVCADVIAPHTLQCYISSDGATLYFFYYYTDYDSTRITCLNRWSGGFLPNPNGTWMTSIDTNTYGTLKANTRRNIALSCEGNSATATALTTSAGSATQPVYFSSGKPVATTYTLGASVPSGAVFTDTKNTSGSTDTSSKIFLVGATSQAANPQTYSDNQVYATNGQLNSNSMRIAECVTLQYDSNTEALNFVFG